jgi:hypothetical protein
MKKRTDGSVGENAVNKGDDGRDKLIKARGHGVLGMCTGGETRWRAQRTAYLG